ncbi:L-type lectin-domain containing receptor kinase V.9 [Curcuma longa]|uniref:L-type lectin-domain containing receptor kinase V.9 n=1 Tax=Curcuma longa TaxID=136217 RepID=UPI003D9EA809
MASASPLLITFFCFLLLSLTILATSRSSLIEELNRPPPPDFAATVAANCARDPSLRYCNCSADLPNVYKSTVVARHLCVESRNPDCNRSFPRIDLRSRPNLAPLYLSFAFFWAYCPSSVLAIDLANNSLAGGFPSAILLCTHILSLDLSYNALAGDVPVDLFSNLHNLSSLNLSYNHFSECGSDCAPFFRLFNSSSFIHSGLRPEDHRHSSEITATVLLLTGVLASIFFLLCIVCVLVRRRKGDRYQFTTEALREATRGFGERNLIRKGEKEDLYVGRLRNGLQIEVHVQRGRASKAFLRAFEEDCTSLLRLRHRNLAKVIGWCNERELLAVVVEMAHICSVEEWLLQQSPPWKQRLKVLMGVVDGVCYLEEHWPRVGYDIRTRSISLTREIEPLISKVGVGISDSESKKVQRLGLFVLELIANKRPREVFEAGETGLIEWVKVQFPAQVKKLIDEKMKPTATTLEQIRQIISIALEAAANASSSSMSHVCRLLRKACAVDQEIQKQTRSRSHKHHRR